MQSMEGRATGKVFRLQNCSYARLWISQGDFAAICGHSPATFWQSLPSAGQIRNRYSESLKQITPSVRAQHTQQFYAHGHTSQVIAKGHWARPKKRSGPKSASVFARRKQPGPVLEKSVMPARRWCLYSGAPAAGQSCDQSDDEHHQENEKQKLRDSGRCYRNAAEPEYRGDDRNDQKYKRPIKHTASYLLTRTATFRC